MSWVLNVLALALALALIVLLGRCEADVHRPRPAGDDGAASIFGSPTAGGAFAP